HTMTGTMDEEWFYLIMTDLEAKAGTIYPIMLTLDQLIKPPFKPLNQTETEQLVQSLQTIEQTIDSMRRVIKRMSEKCAPQFFYHQLRPFLTGWADHALFPNGMIYTGVSPMPTHYVGGSAAQSSIFPVLD